jgi:hypothetical protein
MNPTLQTSRFGWWSLLCWLTLGLALESLHGFKVGWYLDVVHEGRRLQWTLAHSHGTLLSLVCLAFAATVRGTEATAARHARAGWCLRWAAVLMPVGFLLGGVFAMGADPGLPVVLVPVGGLLLFGGVLLSAQLVRADDGSAAPPRAGR